MSTTIYLIRHGRCESQEIYINGRMANIFLTDEGHLQADSLASKLKKTNISRIYSSPQERARQTAKPLAHSLNLIIHDLYGFQEVDYGDWTGCRIEDLKTNPKWIMYNSCRHEVTIPGGESFLELQLRIQYSLNILQVRHPNEVIAIFSHKDIIRTALMNLLDMSSIHLQKLEISNCSVSIINLGDSDPSVFCINCI